MNRNNSSSDIRDDDIEDLRPTTYDGEMQRLKCENFQLRLTCYNYECTLNEFESLSKNNDFTAMKNSYEEKLQNYYFLEDKLKTIQRENLDFKEQIDEYLKAKDQIHVPSLMDRGTQVAAQCTDCTRQELSFKRTVDELSQKIVELENENLRLHSSLQETKELLIKKETFEASCNTVNVSNPFFYDEGKLSDTESESATSDLVTKLPLDSLIQHTLVKINSFLESYKNEERKISQLEMGIVSLLHGDLLNDGITDDKYKSCLFKDDSLSNDEKYINFTLVKCRDQLINTDYQQISAYLSDSDDDTRESMPNNQISMKNPNILVINSILEKLTDRNEDIKVMKQKIKLNKKWTKNISMFDQIKLTKNIETGIREEIDIHTREVSELLSNLTTLIPAVKLTFSKTIGYLESVRQLQNEKINTSMSNYHQTNERLFLDNCNLFIQSMSNCLLALNKEKMFLNSANELFPSIYFDDDDRHNVVVEVIYQPQLEDGLFTVNSVRHDKETSTNPTIGHDMPNQTDFKGTIRKDKLTISPQVCITADDDVDIFQGYIEETRSPSLKSYDTFTIDESKKIVTKDRRVIMAGACGDVISETLTKTQTFCSAKQWADDSTIKDFGFEIRNKESKLRKFSSLESFRYCDSNTTTDNIQSLMEYNNSNNGYQSDLDHQILNTKAGCASSSINIFNKSDSMKISKPLSINSSRLTLCSQSQSPTDMTIAHSLSYDQTTTLAEILSHMRLRIMKLLYIHDFRFHVHEISKKDALIAEEFSDLNTQFGPNKSNQWAPYTKLLSDIEKGLEKWHKELTRFTNISEKGAVIPKWLLTINDSELIQQLFVKKDSKIDFDLLGGDKMNSDCEVFVALEYLSEDLNKQYETLDELYKYLLKKRELFQFQVAEECKYSSSNAFQDFQRQISELLKTNETLRLENHNLFGQIDEIKSAKTKDFILLSEEKTNINLELNKVLSDKATLAKELDKTIENGIIKSKGTQKEINELIISNNNLKIEINTMLHHSVELNNSIDHFKEDICVLKHEKETFKDEIKAKDTQILENEIENKILESQITLIKEHERQLLKELKKWKNSEQIETIKTDELKLELEKSNIKIIAQEIAMKDNVERHLCQLNDWERKLNQMTKISDELREKNRLLDDEISNYKNAISSEMIKSTEINRKKQLIDKELERNNDKWKLFSSMMNNVQEQCSNQIDSIIELIIAVDSTVSKSSLKAQVDAIPLVVVHGNDDINQLCNVSKIIDASLTILVNQINQTKLQSLSVMEQKSVQVNIVESVNKEFIGKHNYNERRGDNVKKNATGKKMVPDNKLIQNHRSINSLVRQAQVSPKRDQPIPLPRQSFNHTAKQHNENNIDLSTSTTLDVANQGEDLGIDENDQLCLSEDNDNTSRISEHQTFPLDTQVTNESNGLDPKYLPRTSDMMYFLVSKLNTDRSFQNTKEFKELSSIVRYLDCEEHGTSLGQQCNLYASNSSPSNENGNIDKLIDNNRYLTSNLIKTTRKLLSLQDKLELLNSELRQSQIAKHEMYLELASKYEKLALLQSELDSLKGNTKMVEDATQTTRTNKSLCDDPEQRDGTKSRCSTYTISQSEEIPQFLADSTNSIANTKAHFDGDWDDVTRTMIRCLTTLSEVQQTLVTPTFDEDSFILTTCAQPSGHDSKPNTNCSHQRTIEFISSSNTKTKDSTNIKNGSTIKVTIMKETKYQVIRNIIFRIKEYLKSAKDSKRQESETSTPIDQLIQVDKLVKKLYSFLTNNIIIRELSSNGWDSLFSCKDLHNVVPDNISHGNPLEATDRVQSDIVRLQQRLEKYQYRYKSLKNAVMANKYKFNETHDPDVSGI